MQQYIIVSNLIKIYTPANQSPYFVKCRELQRISREAAKAFDELQTMRSSVAMRKSADVSRSSSLIGAEGINASIIRAPPLLNPSASPPKKNSSSNSDASRYSKGDIGDSILFEVDKSIADYKKCCSALAEL